MLKLNVGGTMFTTTLDTLSKYESFFSSLVRFNDKNEYFIDRDPTHFRYILNYLRGSSAIPENLQTLYELKAEADFYCLQEMVENINLKITMSSNHLHSIVEQLKLLVNKINL